MNARYDLVIVGAGSAGLTAAELAARLRLRVAIVERDRVGGDCLWTGCVPSKSLVAAARAAHTMRHARRFGLPAAEPEIDLAAVWDRIRAVRREIETADDDPEVLARRGVEVVVGTARLDGPGRVRVGGRVLETRFVLLATGSHPAVPAIEGLDAAGYLTTDSVWELDRPPTDLAILGGGPVAIELAQAFARLGGRVTVAESADRILPDEEPDLAARLADLVRGEGVTVLTSAETTAVRVGGGRRRLDVLVGGQHRTLDADAVLVATGRVANVDDLGLDAVGVEHGPGGVAVDDRLRTTAEGVFAVGDVAGRYRFTHAAGYEAAIALRNMFFPFSQHADALVPWCTFTDPELAHVGLTVAQARARHGKRVRVHDQQLRDSDRARVDAATDGLLRLVTARGRLVGAHALAPAAGELANELSLAVGARMRLGALAGVVHVYPTLGLGFQELAADAVVERAARWRVLTRWARPR